MHSVYSFDLVQCNELIWHFKCYILCRFIVTGSCRPFQRSPQMQYMYELYGELSVVFQDPCNICILCLCCLYVIQISAVWVVSQLWLVRTTNIDNSFVQSCLRCERISEPVLTQFPNNVTIGNDISCELETGSGQDKTQFTQHF